ncbi:ROK family transcriptional regulator [Yinghuangia soli]|uniref:ROK family transcriptional regulator n=1 Tax=Yinghuangia soli TaxID=2908204 RepID=A0AA41PWP4_9ACTN|nr:ROK family transcriptional regulator [Yinghuangia soli]MCF2526566.1 ROK family transcriptional regulator [Yinghuangia soli]
MARRANPLPHSSAGEVLQLVRDGEAETRADVARLTGLSRSAVAARVDDLVDAGLLVERADRASTGGRPPMRLELNAAGGVVLAASLGSSRGQLAVCDLTGRVLATRETAMAAGSGPEAVLSRLPDWFDALLAEEGYDPGTVRGIGVAVPGTVELATGRAVGPPTLPGWDGVAIAPALQRRWPVPVYVDNDVNVMALGEYRTRGDAGDLVFVKVSTGIGAGIVSEGKVYRGALGAAGEIGHIPVAGGTGTRCWCGNVDCLEVLASGRHLVETLAAHGAAVSGVRDVVALAAAGHPEAVRLVRESGRLLGEVLASVVNVLNPAVVVLGGDLADAGDPLLAGVREVVYRRSTAVATRELKIVASRLGEEAGLAGCAVMALDRILAPESVDATLARHAAQRAVDDAVPA